MTRRAGVLTVVPAVVPAVVLAVVLCLAGCQAAPPKQPDWADWIARVDAMDAATLGAAQDEALHEFTSDPVDRNRLRAGYALSRPGASLAQLEQAREITAPIPADSDLAAYRELLDHEIRLRMELRRTQLRLTEEQLEVERLQARTGELERRIEGLLNQVRNLQTQLETLKAIEEDMVETQQRSDEVQR
jgi:hypothetical protein